MKVALTCFAFFISCNVSAQNGYLNALRNEAKFPDSLVVSEVSIYKDGTVCGNWRSKDSYGIYSRSQGFTFKQRKLVNESISNNPYCSNLDSKEIAHETWSNLNVLISRKANLEAKYKQAEASYDLYSKYCGNSSTRSLCESAEKRKTEMQEYTVELDSIEEKIKSERRNLEAAIAG